MSLLFIIAFFTLLLLSMFFSLSETALVSLSPQKSKALSINHPNLSKELSQWLEQPQELLTLILTGNTLVNIMFATLVTAYAFFTFPQWDARIIDGLSWLISTLVLVVLGEMAPKMMARLIPEKATVFVLPLLSRMKFVVIPIFRMISAVTDLLIKTPVSFKLPSDKIIISSDDFKSLLEEGEKASSKELRESFGFMKKVLELHDQRIEKIMTPLEKIDFVEIDPNGKKIRDEDLLLDLIIEDGHTRTPIKKAGQFVGFVHTRDLLKWMAEEESTKNFTSILRQPLAIRMESSVRNALDLFQNAGVHMAFVYNKLGQISGLVTLEDVLEEITGEIMDEYDVSA